MAVVPVILRILAEKSSEFAGVINEVRQSFGGIAQALDTARIKASQFTGILTAGLGGIAGLAVRQAGEFEQLQAKLISVTGSVDKASAAFLNATKVAANSPFDVQGVVAATATIEAFGQRSKEVLPLAANLAAAFGNSVQEGALTLGKAFAGSLEGFESLRSTYGISNIELRKFGAELTKTGGIAITTSAGLAKAQQALTNIIQLKYGDAISRQSQTLFGAFSNLQDAISRVAAAFGNELVPIVTAGTRVITAIVEKFEALDPAVRSFIVANAVLVAGLAAFSSATLAAIGAIGSLIGPLLLVGRVLAGLRLFTVVAGAVGGLARSFSLLSVATSAANALFTLGRGVASIGIVSRIIGPVQSFARVLGTFASVTGVSGPLFSVASAINNIGKAAGIANLLSRFSQALGAARIAAAGFLGIGLGPALLLAGAAVAGVTAILGAYRRESEQADAETKAQAASLHDSVAEFRNLRDILEELSGQKYFDLQAPGQVAAIAGAVADSLAKLSPLELQQRMKSLGVTTEDFSAKLKENRDAAEKAKGKIEELTAKVDEYQRAIDAEKESPFGGNSDDISVLQGALEKAKISLEGFQQEYRNLGGNKAILDGVIDSAKAADKAFADAATSSRQLGAYIQEATKSNNVADLASSLGLVNGRLAEVKAKYAALGLPVENLAALQAKLLTATDEQIPAIKEIIGLLEGQVALQKKLTDTQDQQVKEKLRQADLAIERENQAKGNDLSRERKRVADELNLVRTGSEEELSIRRRLATIDGQLHTQRVAKAKASFDEEQLAGKDALEKIRANEGGADAISRAIQDIITKTEAWEAANKTLLSSDAGLRKQVSSTLLGLQKDLNTANAAIPKEKLDKALVAAKEFGTEAVTAEQKLAAATNALTSLRQLQESGAITSAQQRTRLQQEINRLTTEELRLKQQVTKEENAQARETAGLKRGGLETELELLRARQEITGKDQTSAIRRKEQQILAERIQAIRDQEQAEIDSNVNAERAHENAEIRITQVKNEETLKRIKADQDATKSVEDEAKRQQAIIDQFRQQRQGGLNSPLKSLAEVGFDSTSLGLGDFSLGDFGTGFGQQRRQTVPSGIFGFQQQVDRDIREGDRAAGRGQKDPFADQINQRERNRAEAASGLAQAPVTNIYLTLNAQTFDVKNPKTKQDIRELVDEYATEGAHRGVA